MRNSTIDDLKRRIDNAEQSLYEGCRTYIENKERLMRGMIKMHEGIEMEHIQHSKYIEDDERFKRDTIEINEEIEMGRIQNSNEDDRTTQYNHTMQRVEIEFVDERVSREKIVVMQYEERMALLNSGVHRFFKVTQGGAQSSQPHNDPMELAQPK